MFLGFRSPNSHLSNAPIAATTAAADRTIVPKSPDRFARDLMVQLAGHDMLKAKGVTLIAASAPTFFVEDTPTAVLVRQVLGAVAQFEKATTVAKLRSGVHQSARP